MYGFLPNTGLSLSMMVYLIVAVVLLIAGGTAFLVDKIRNRG